MSQSFPAEGSGNSLKWSILIALLIDAPFLLITLFSSGEPKLVSLLFTILPLSISGLIVYASYASGKMRYIIGEDELRISFPLSPLRILYDKIRYAGKVETSLRFRLFGGSLPGSHWGIFTTSSIGNTQVYTTKYKGEFVLLELVDGTRILISPREPDALLEALRGKTSFTAPTTTEVVEPRLNRRLAITQIAVVAVAWLALVSYVLSIYSGLPEIIPVHFGLDGVPNRYGSKLELLILVAVSALYPSLNTVFAIKYGKYNRGLTLFLSVVFLLAVGLFALIVNQILQAI
jgi:hypothetical protein